jgi:hypothetical protein
MKIHIFVFILLVEACSNPQNSETVNVNTSPAMTDVSSVSNTEKLLTKIMGKDGLVRGVQFGDDIAEVKKKEGSAAFEEDDKHIGFSFDTENLETVDIIYQKDKNNRVKGIELSIYMNTNTSNDSLKSAMSAYFTNKFGNPLPKSDNLAWGLKPAGKVSIKVVQNKLDRGLEVKFTKDSDIQ